MQNMTDEFKLAPSILSADFSDLGSALKIYAQSKASPNFYAQGAIMLHFQMRIFLVLGVFFVQVKMGK